MDLFIKEIKMDFFGLNTVKYSTNSSCIHVGQRNMFVANSGSGLDARAKLLQITV